ncbi:hypothetical protein F2P81_015225 [Scophthalmus maximus]|uniref:Uncharacterized protein n=1 Tax=Scophthalmus maximus TaxID=52904 RepID=A0A6A4SK85_SCOMX|nr:hypothetical protein F2P81_015225 [Scophthalmus maximus]
MDVKPVVDVRSCGCVDAHADPGNEEPKLNFIKGPQKAQDGPVEQEAEHKTLATLSMKHAFHSSLTERDEQRFC